MAELCCLTCCPCSLTELGLAESSTLPAREPYIWRGPEAGVGLQGVVDGCAARRQRRQELEAA